MLMIRFLVYIKNKPKTNDRFTFSGTVRLTEPCLALASSHPFDLHFFSQENGLCPLRGV